MYNPDTGRVSLTRDIRWLGGLIGDDARHQQATDITNVEDVHDDADGDSTVSGESDHTDAHSGDDNSETDADTDADDNSDDDNDANET